MKSYDNYSMGSGIFQTFVRKIYSFLLSTNICFDIIHLEPMFVGGKEE